ncbi:hypothetical protein H2248_002976 [Termitomyces sp. 'cryptogamus']|nr:hypothetical protein H2248_002976 [Termitomyces sp. 'cryptogamus']
MALSSVLAAIKYPHLETLPYKFTLAAWNTSSSNDNTTGVPLVLGQNGATTGAALYVTSTYASYPYNDFPALELVNNSLHALTASGDWFTNATTPMSGRPLAWRASRYYRSFAAQNYSALPVPGSRFPLLAVYGIASSWSLCATGVLRGQVNVVFNVSGMTTLGYDMSKCYGVVLHIVKREW